MRSLILNTVNGQTEQLTDWSQINWRKVNKLLRNLQRRIFRARKLGQWKQLRRLQKLLLKSYVNLLSSVRQITQINQGKNTPGADGEVIKTPKGRVKLVNSWVMPKAKPTRRVFIPKTNGKKRPLGIPKLEILTNQPLLIKCTGHGQRQVIHVDKHCFPRLNKSGHQVRKSALIKAIKGFQTGDIVRAIVTKGKKIGSYLGQVAVRSSGSFNIKTATSTVQGINYKYCSIIQHKDGYLYQAALAATSAS